MRDLTCALDVKTHESLDILGKVNACVELLKPTKNLQNIIDLLRICYLESNETAENSFLVKAKSIANSFFILGYLKALLNSKIPLIDPVMKVSLKQKYCLEEISDLEKLKRNYELQNLIYSDSPKTLHSYCVLLTAKIEELKKKIEKYEKYVAVRPAEISYKSLSEVMWRCDWCKRNFHVVCFSLKVINHAFATILSGERVLDVYNEINYATQVTSEQLKIKKAIQKCASSVLSLENFINELSRYRFTHRDIVEALLSNIMEHLYGFKLQIDLLRHLCVCGADLQTSLEKFVQFPSLDETQNDFLGHINFYLKGDLMQVVLRNEGGGDVSEQQIR